MSGEDGLELYEELLNLAGSSLTAAAKSTALEAAGIPVAPEPHQAPDLLWRGLRKRHG